MAGYERICDVGDMRSLDSSYSNIPEQPVQNLKKVLVKKVLLVKDEAECKAFAAEMVQDSKTLMNRT